MSIKRELVTCTELQTEVVTPTGTTYSISNDNAAFVRIRSTAAFLFLGNASDGDEVTLAADTWHRLPCYHQTLYLKQATTAGFSALQMIWEK
jgi:hypothetical protein